VPDFHASDRCSIEAALQPGRKRVKPYSGSIAR
jgi:hypothetical protein